MAKFITEELLALMIKVVFILYTHSSKRTQEEEEKKNLSIYPFSCLQTGNTF